MNCRPYRSGEIVDDNGIVVKFLSGRVTFTHQLFHARLFLCTHNVYHCSLERHNVTDKGTGYGKGGGGVMGRGQGSLGTYMYTCTSKIGSLYP